MKKKLCKNLVLYANNMLFSFQVTVLEEGQPDGCAIVTVSDKVSAHLVLKGIVDPVKEVEKLEKKKATLASQLEKLVKSMAGENFKEILFALFSILC